MARSSKPSASSSIAVASGSRAIDRDETVAEHVEGVLEPRPGGGELGLGGADGGLEAGLALLAAGEDLAQLRLALGRGDRPLLIAASCTLVDSISAARACASSRAPAIREFRSSIDCAPEGVLRSASSASTPSAASVSAVASAGARRKGISAVDAHLVLAYGVS